MWIYPPMDYKVNFRNNFSKQIQMLQLRRNKRSSFLFYIIIWNLCNEDVILIQILRKFLDIRQLNIYF